MARTMWSLKRPPERFDKGDVFLSRDGRRAEVFQTSDDDWAVEMYHLYGCTCFAYTPSKDEALDALVEYTDVTRGIVEAARDRKT